MKSENTEIRIPQKRGIRMGDSYPKNDEVFSGGKAKNKRKERTET